VELEKERELVKQEGIAKEEEEIRKKLRGL